MVAHVGGRQVGWSAMDHPGSGCMRVGRNPCWLARLRRGDACGCRLSFLKGVGCTPSPLPPRVPGETLGSVRAAASSSSHSFLKVLFGMWLVGVLGAWWNSPEGAAVAGHPRLVDLPLLALVSFSFLFLVFSLLGAFVMFAPAVVSQLYGWLLY